jgi:integrase
VISEEQLMGKAKTLTAQELRRVQDYIASRAHAARNRAMLLLTHLAGMRVGEVAALTRANEVTRTLMARSTLGILCYAKVVEALLYLHHTQGAA